MDKFIVTIAGIFSIAAIYWFFFGKKPSFAKASDGQGKINVVVDGGYTPSVIQIPLGQPTTLRFTRTDPNTCMENVIMEGFKMKKFLPMNIPVAITISPTKPGTYDFHCDMNMFHGKIEVI